MERRIGRQSISFKKEVFILDSASCVGKKEGEGPLGSYFDLVSEDHMFGGESWEEAESNLQKQAAQLAIEKSGVDQEEIGYIFAGDLLAQSTASCFGIKTLNIPLFGLFGACSTIGEALSLGSIALAAKAANYVVSLTSSHFGSAEKEFRFPLEYGNQRPLSASWTVTGSGAYVLSKDGGKAEITGITTGKIVDFGLKDSQNMGACMAPAASDTIYHNLVEFHRQPSDYDKIITGDLGSVGKTILLDLLNEKGYDIEDRYLDCGIEIFDHESQDTHAGGSGCGCAASVLSAYILPKIESGTWKRVLFVPTGALMSKVSYAEGKSVPGIAHGVVIESCRR